MKESPVQLCQQSPSSLRKSVSWPWWSPPAEPFRCPWGQKLETLFPSNPPASRKCTSWCLRHRRRLGWSRNPSICPGAGAWGARGCRDRWPVGWRRRKRPWGWRVCPCRVWGGWRVGRLRNTRPRCRCHVHCHGRTWWIPKKRGGGGSALPHQLDPLRATTILWSSEQKGQCLKCETVKWKTCAHIVTI